MITAETLRTQSNFLFAGRYRQIKTIPQARKISFERQKGLPVEYKGVKLDCGYRLDVVAEDAVILELKACDRLEPIHQAQLLTYLKVSNLSVGLLLNFNVTVMRDGIVRVVNEFKD